MEREEWMPGKGVEEKVRINRVLMIDEAIRSGNFPTIKRLARKAEVNERTIERDIEYLRDMPLSNTTGRSEATTTPNPTFLSKV